MADRAAALPDAAARADLSDHPGADRDQRRGVPEALSAEGAQPDAAPEAHLLVRLKARCAQTLAAVAASGAAAAAPRAHASRRAADLRVRAARRAPGVQAAIHAALAAAAGVRPVRRNVHAPDLGLAHALVRAPAAFPAAVPAASDRAGGDPGRRLFPVSAERALLAPPAHRQVRSSSSPRARRSSPAAAVSSPWYVVSLRFRLCMCRLSRRGTFRVGGFIVTRLRTKSVGDMTFRRRDPPSAASFENNSFHRASVPAGHPRSGELAFDANRSRRHDAY
jgi:hypothetical protein